MAKGLNDPKFQKFMTMVARSRENEANATKERNKPVWPTFISRNISKDWTFVKYDQQPHEYVFERDNNGQRIEMRYIPEIDEVTVTVPKDPNNRSSSPTKFVYDIKKKTWESAFPRKDKHYNQDTGEWGYCNIITGDWTYIEIKEMDPLTIPENLDKDVFKPNEMVKRLEYQDIRTMETFYSIAVDVDGYQMVYNLETGNFEYMIGTNAGRAKFIPRQGVWDIKVNKNESDKSAQTELCFNIFTGQKMELVDKENDIYAVEKTPEEKAAERARQEAERAKKEAAERARQEAEKAKKEAEERARQETERAKKEAEERAKQEAQAMQEQPAAIQGMNEINFEVGQSQNDDTKITITGLEGYEPREIAQEDYHRVEIARAIQDSILGDNADEQRKEKDNASVDSKKDDQRAKKGKKNTKEGKDKTNTPNTPKKPGLFARFTKWLKEFLGLNYEVPQLDEGLDAREERAISKITRKIENTNNLRRINTEKSIRDEEIHQDVQKQLKSQQPAKSRQKVKPEEQEKVTIDLQSIYKYESDYTDIAKESKLNKIKEFFENKGKSLSKAGGQLGNSTVKTITILASTAGTAITNSTKKAVSELSDEWKMIIKTIKGYPSRLKKQYEKTKRTIKGYSKKAQRYYGKNINIKLASILMAVAIGLTGSQRYNNNMPYLGDEKNNTTFVDSNPSEGLDQVFNDDGTINATALNRHNIDGSKTGKKINKPANSIETNQSKGTSNKKINAKPTKEASQNRYIAPDTLTIGTQTTRYQAEQGITYTATAQGTGASGTLRQDTNIEIFNRAIVQVNEDGSVKTLLTSKGMSWEEFAKEYGMSIEQIQELLKQSNIKEMVAMQVAGAEHDIRYVYGWTQASNLQGNMQTQNRAPQKSNLSRGIDIER